MLPGTLGADVASGDILRASLSTISAVPGSSCHRRLNHTSARSSGRHSHECKQVNSVAYASTRGLLLRSNHQLHLGGKRMNTQMNASHQLESSRKKRLHIPGPTNIPPQVLAALSRPAIGHRSSEYAHLHADVTAKAKTVFQTSNDLLLLTASGSGGMEAAVANTVRPGDPVLALVGGKFGERFALMAERYGADVQVLEVKWGMPFNTDEVRRKLKQDGPYKVVFATHNETSTGITNDIASIGALVRETPALLVVDTISSMGAMEIRTDEWHVDIMVTGSQKALMLPPGLALVSISDKAWQVIETQQPQSFYFDLLAARKSAAKSNTPWTPAVNLVAGLQASLDLLLEEGLDNVYRRHATVAAACRRAITALGLELFPPEEFASHTVTAVKAPAGFDIDAFTQVLSRKYGIVIAGGQGQLKGEIFRIGHMGYIDYTDMLAIVSALEMALVETGYDVPLGTGVSAAQKSILTATRQQRLPAAN